MEGSNPSFGDIEFAVNPEPRCPCVLLLDTSGSMAGAPIESLNNGLQTFRDHLNQDPIAARRVEVAVVTFNSTVNVEQDFVSAKSFSPPTLDASGATCMGGGILAALDLVSAEKQKYKTYGIAHYRPWIFMITDGEPQGEEQSVIENASQRIAADEANKRIAFFAVGVEGANMDRLQQIVVRAPLKLRGLDFRELFVWLSASLQSVSGSDPGDQVRLQPIGWGEV